MKGRTLSAIAGAALPMLRHLDPEAAHTVALAGLACLRPLWPRRKAPAQLAVQCAGLRFAHPLGLAAGFDKSGDHLDALGAIGFSHIEVGTVTPRPQPGNAKPRMFRLSAAEALVNCMGFNNKGADHLAERMARSAYRGVRGISIGKNFDTPIERAEGDYVECLRKLYAYADYVAVNVSSPNTLRLRELQAQNGLRRIVGSLIDERRALQRRYGKKVPLFVKVAPDLDPEGLAAFAAELRALAVDGVIATNTSNDLRDFAAALPPAQGGGLSGRPLHRLALATIRQLRARLGSAFPIIGVGGIFGAEEAMATLQAGANLIQVYTGFAYRGPRLLDEILRSFAERQARPTDPR